MTRPTRSHTLLWLGAGLLAALGTGLLARAELQRQREAFDTDARIARCLAALFNPVLYPGTNRLLRISQEELGYLAGVSRQRANRCIATWILAARVDLDPLAATTRFD